MKTDVITQVAEIEISYKPAIQPSARLEINSPVKAERVFRSIWKLSMEHRESFYALFLDRSNKLLGYLLVSVGGLTGTVVDPRIIFQTALKANSCCVILAHNHPSGNPRPSETDIRLTRKLMEAGKLLDIQVLDHLILVPGGFTSLANEGILG